MIIVNTAIKFLNPLFPNYKNLHKYWWHWLAVGVVIISSSLFWIWVMGFALLFLGFSAFLHSDPIHVLIKMIISGPFIWPLAIGIFLPAILYRVFLRMLGISNKSSLRKAS